jgi:hypothetical protein
LSKNFKENREEEMSSPEGITILSNTDKLPEREIICNNCNIGILHIIAESLDKRITLLECKMCQTHFKLEMGRIKIYKNGTAYRSYI